MVGFFTGLRFLFCGLNVLWTGRGVVLSVFVQKILIYAGQYTFKLFLRDEDVLKCLISRSVLKVIIWINCTYNVFQKTYSENVNKKERAADRK